jgi:dsDNA-specific endonuclease/ATPase MutS2
MAKYHFKERIDIIVEGPDAAGLIDKFDRARVPGFSVLPIIEGKGMGNYAIRRGRYLTRRI